MDSALVDEATDDGRTRLTIDAYLVPGGPAKLLRGVLKKKFTHPSGLVRPFLTSKLAESVADLLTTSAPP